MLKSKCGELKKRRIEIDTKKRKKKYIKAGDLGPLLQ